MGHEVILPSLPNPDNPTEEEWVATALAATTYDDKAVLVGHSLGAVAALKVLEKLDKPIARLVTVGGFVSKNFKDNPRPFEKTFTWNFDGQKIRNNVKSITILHDPRDYVVSDAQAKELADLLQTEVTVGKSTEPHFTGDKEQDVLMWLRPTMRVFTTRADTLYGASFLVVAPEHQWITLALQHKTVLHNNDEVQAYIDNAAKKTERERTENKEKTGVELKGVKAVNPTTGERIPIFVADYALAGFGTGALFGDAHDERDTEFAHKFGIPLKETLAPEFVDKTNPPQLGKEHTDRNIILAVVYNPKTKKYLCLKWKEQPWTTFVTGGIDAGENAAEAAKREIAEETGYTSISLVKSLGHTYSNFYAAHKGVNRRVHNRSFLFELVDETHVEVASDEKNAYDVVWLSADEVVAANLQHAEFDFIWQRIKKDIPFEGKGVLYDSGEFSGLTSDEALPKITAEFGRATKKYHLRDWVVSRQRFWGVPIPMIKCETCGYNPVPEDQLPVVLPDLEDYLPTDEGRSPLAKKREWVEVSCPTCGGKAERETDTLDTFVDSSWYFQRYTDPANSGEFARKDKLENWLPVDLYSGGSEHTTMHVLYSRFWHKAMFDLGLVGESEPYLRRMNRGLIMGPDGQKMSKSKGNVVDPDQLVSDLGADTVRMYLAFIGPYNEVGSYPWNPQAAVGVRRFLDRVYKLPVQDDAPDMPMDATIEAVTKNIESLKLNTGVSALMIALNEFEKSGGAPRKAYATFLNLLAPFAPHIAHELAETHGINLGEWPTFDPAKLKQAMATVAVQVNGKMRTTIDIATDAPEAEALAVALKAAEKWVSESPTKVVYRAGKVINLVIPDA